MFGVIVDIKIKRLRVVAFLFIAFICPAEQSRPPARVEAPAPIVVPTNAPAAPNLNLLGKTDTQAGEAKRNDNVSFDLVDNNALKEQNSRLGTSATVIREFLPQHNYFGAEFGNSPSSIIHLSPSAASKRWHGALREKHVNSVVNSRRFFQVGPVQPAHENDYSGDLTAPFGSRVFVTLFGGKQKVRET